MYHYVVKLCGHKVLAWFAHRFTR